jgi:membrane associated rhomboid family serine protease
LIPIRDTVPSRRSPLVNWTVIGACALVFWTELSAGPQLEGLIHAYGLIPDRFLKLAERGGALDPGLWVPFATSTLLHGGWAHFLGNMLYLWIFGDNVEDRLGHVGYALFYLGGGVAAGLAHVWANPGSVVPTIGASGAIAAVMGAYFVLFPHARIVTVLIIFFAVRVVPIPAFFYLAMWFVMQLVAGTAELATSGGPDAGVAWWAHLGGFAFGAGVAVLLRAAGLGSGR